jgi:hypothetical protein
MATWEEVRDAVWASDPLRNYMFEYLRDNGNFRFLDEDDAWWFFNASIGYSDPKNKGHRHNCKAFCTEFLPEYESLTKQHSPEEDSSTATPD